MTDRARGTSGRRKMKITLIVSVTIVKCNPSSTLYHRRGQVAASSSSKSQFYSISIERQEDHNFSCLHSSSSSSSSAALALVVLYIVCASSPVLLIYWFSVIFPIRARCQEGVHETIYLLFSWGSKVVPFPSSSPSSNKGVDLSMANLLRWQNYDSQHLATRMMTTTTTRWTNKRR